MAQLLLVLISIICIPVMHTNCETTVPTLDDVEELYWEHIFLVNELPRSEVKVLATTYNAIVEQLKTLKEQLYNNFTKIDDNDIPPPRGSKVMYNEELGTVQIVTRIGIYLYPDRIVRMDVEQQCLTLLLREVLVWYDESLQWSRDGGVLLTDIHMNSSEIWTPPILASHVVAEEEVINSGLVSVYSDGLCIMSRSVQYTMPCAVNVENFPFDMHTCYLRYTQLTTSHYRLFFSLIGVGYNNTRADKVLLTKQYAHLEWVGVSVSHNLTGETNDGLEFTITLQRQSHFYAIVLIFPTVLLNILSLVVFTLPIDNTERENFSLTLTLTYFVLVMIIVDTSPPTGNQIPKLGLYVIMCTVIVVLTFGMSLTLIELHEHKRAKKRKMSKALFEFLKQCCCFERCFTDYHLSTSRGSYAVDDEPVEESTPLKYNKNNNTTTTMDIKREEFKWKLLANVLNYVFFVLTLIAHIMLPCLIYIG